MRLDYVPNPPTGLSTEDEAVVERVKARRGAIGLVSLDLTLLHTPKLADGQSTIKSCVPYPEQKNTDQTQLQHAGMRYSPPSALKASWPTTFARSQYAVPR
jgi:hypothetical protein